MKGFKLTFLFILIAVITNAQAPVMEWERCFGGSSMDTGGNIIQTSDSGYIAVGGTMSNDYDVVCNIYSQYSQAFVVRLSATYTTKWIKCLGGSHIDGLSSILETLDYGFILAGSTESNDGDVSDNHGKRDGWVVKLDNAGEIVWQKCYGGTETDIFNTQIPQLKSFDMSKIFCNGFSSIFRHFLTKLQ